MIKRKPGSRSKLLVGWDRIAAYLSCSVATAKRRQTEGLPIVRVGGAVCALTEDVDTWARSRGYVAGRL